MDIKKSSKILYCLLIVFVILFLSGIILIIYNNKKVIKYDEIEIKRIVKYLDVNSMFYDGIISDIDIINNNVNVSLIDDIYFNKQIASYVITNVSSNSDYDKSKCISCYKYFSDDDDIRFYDVDTIDNIYKYLLGNDIKRINQDDKIGFNIIYYNEDIDMYYINIAFNSYDKNYISVFKEYSYNKDKLYIDYYYTKVEYDDMEDKNESNNIRLYNIDGKLMTEVSYNEFYDEDGGVLDIDSYVEYFDIVRYEFKYNYKSKKFILDKVVRVEN